ncbi:hypothetical protein J6590_075283 [Homalodisca vitripennis]|nr:hypothetical protein J6590_075283 [Homalodisca vitripennis]
MFLFQGSSYCWHVQAPPSRPPYTDTSGRAVTRQLAEFVTRSTRPLTVWRDVELYKSS